MSKKWNPIWLPELGETYYYDPLDTGVNYSTYEHDFHDQALVRTYNAFPNRQLTRLGLNLSKLGRMILLWQYANDCVFEPDWNKHFPRKWFLSYDHLRKLFRYQAIAEEQEDIIYFAKKEQVKTFIEMYEKEILDLMGSE